MGHAVAVAFNLDAAVDVYAHRFKDSTLPGLYWQGHQGWGVDLRKYAGTAAGQLLEGALVEPVQQGRDGVVDLFHAGELMLAQACQDPAFDQQRAKLDLRFVLR